MTITVEAIYTGGVLKPAQPLALTEGDTVQITISACTASAPALPVEGIENEAKKPAGIIDADFEKAAEKVFNQHEELLRRLA